MDARHRVLANALANARRREATTHQLDMSTARESFERQVVQGREAAAEYGLPRKSQWPLLPTIQLVKVWMAVRGTSSQPDRTATAIYTWLREDEMRNVFFPGIVDKHKTE